MSDIDLGHLRQQLADDSRRLSAQLKAAGDQVDSMWTKMRAATRDKPTGMKASTGDTDDHEVRSAMRELARFAAEAGPVTHRALELHSQGGLSGAQAVAQATEELQSTPDKKASR